MEGSGDGPRPHRSILPHGEGVLGHRLGVLLDPLKQDAVALVGQQLPLDNPPVRRSDIGRVSKRGGCKRGTEKRNEKG